MSRVLILDDEAAVRQALALCVTASGHQSEACGNSSEALTRLNTGHFDLLITDYRLSGSTTGLDVALQVRSGRSRIPIILVTGSMHELTPAAIKEAGISAVLSKPFDFQQFQKVFKPLIAVSEDRSGRNLSSLFSSTDPAP